MALQHMIACDNPQCKNVGTPEHYELKKDGTIKVGTLRPPYGWWWLDAACFGSGPYVKLMVCSDECATPALANAVRDMYEHDR